MAIQTQPAESSSRIGDLVHRITDDVKVLAKNEVELAKGELQSSAKTAAVESAVIVLAGIVALIGLGMLCATAVAALSGLIPPLWARLLIMAIIYLIVGGVVAGIFAKRLKRDAKPDVTVPKFEAQRTIAGVKDVIKES